MKPETERIKKFRERTIDYTLRNPSDHRASNLWQEFMRDKFQGRYNIGDYEVRMEAMEFGGEDYP